MILTHHRYFDDHVQSIGFTRDGQRATVGVIAPGEYHFNTQAPERMTVVSGTLKANVAGAGWQAYGPRASFEIGADSGFDVQPVGGPAAYLCEFLA